jgi:hypothetical protein
VAWSIFSQGPAAAAAWAKAFLQGASQAWGVNVDTPANEQFVYDWEKSEGGGGANNPLNQGPDPSHPEFTSTGPQYGGGAADYVSIDAGIAGGIDYLDMPNFSGVKQALEGGNNYQADAQALWGSPWAASHYGYGSAWNTDAMPATTADAANAVLTSSNNPSWWQLFIQGLSPGYSAAKNGAIPNPVSGLTSGVTNDIKKGGAYLIGIGAGAALVVAGIYRVANPGKSITQTTADTAKTAGVAAAAA